MELNNDWSNFDEFVAYLNNPARELFLSLMSDDNSYPEEYRDWSAILEQSESVGFTFDYGLDNIPYDFKTI